MRDDDHLCVSIVPIFNHLDKAEMRAVVDHARPATFEHGESVYRAGEPSAGLYIVHRGRIGIYRISESGKQQLVRILQPGDFTGELSLFSPRDHDAFAKALERVEVCVIRRENFADFLRQYPEISIRMLTEFSDRLAETEHRAAQISMEPVQTRIAMYLADLVERSGGMVSGEVASSATSTASQPAEIELPMSRKDLASHLGTTPETLSRRLADFEEAGWIRQGAGRRIQVLDLTELLLV